MITQLILARVAPLFIALLTLSIAFGQEKEKRIGSIDFFGYAGMNLDQIRSALPIHKGEPYPGPATKSRDPKLLGELRSGALVSLIEMARWQSSGHAYDARILLGRIAGIEEKRLEQLAKEDDVDEIIGALPIRP